MRLLRNTPGGGARTKGASKPWNSCLLGADQSAWKENGVLQFAEVVWRRQAPAAVSLRAQRAAPIAPALVLLTPAEDDTGLLDEGSLLASGFCSVRVAVASHHGPVFGCVPRFFHAMAAADGRWSWQNVCLLS